MIVFLSAIEGLQQGRPSPAAAIGMSRLATFTRLYIEGAMRPRDGDRWLMLRASSGALIEPAQIVHPDPRTLADAPADYRHGWAACITAEIAREVPAGCMIVMLARDPWRRQLEASLFGVWQLRTPWVYKQEHEIVRWLEDHLVLAHESIEDR